MINYVILNFFALFVSAFICLFGVGPLPVLIAWPIAIFCHIKFILYMKKYWRFRRKFARIVAGALLLSVGDMIWILPIMQIED